MEEEATEVTAIVAHLPMEEVEEVKLMMIVAQVPVEEPLGAEVISVLIY